MTCPPTGRPRAKSGPPIWQASLSGNEACGHMGTAMQFVEASADAKITAELNAPWWGFQATQGLGPI